VTLKPVFSSAGRTLSNEVSEAMSNPLNMCIAEEFPGAFVFIFVVAVVEPKLELEDLAFIRSTEASLQMYSYVCPREDRDAEPSKVRVLWRTKHFARGLERQVS
jgi:hypothetical protein